MSRISVLIEGVDFSTFFNKYGATFHYEERLGANGGLMLDGSETVDVLAKEDTTLTIQGRHDPAIIHRARIVIDAVTALAVYDMLAGRFGTDYFAKDE